MTEWTRKFVVSVVAATAFALMWQTHLAHAGNNLLGNGFPSGPHFNLNIIGKKPDFACPSQADYLAGTPDQNVIYVPQVSNEISILMESGAKGPKSAPTQTTLKVTNWCSQTLDGDAAALMLPKNADGYAVFARILGKPGEAGGPTFQFSGREFDLVQDEFGNDLIALGLITDTGVVDYAGNELQRWDGSSKGKGALRAKDISALFQFTGSACAVNDQTTFCSTGGTCVAGPTVCCAPFEDSNGTLVVASACNDPDLLGFGACVPQVETSPGVFACPTQLTIGDTTTTTVVCPVPTACKQFTGSWIFNVADFVNVLYDAQNDGSYNVQIRLYPLPLINGQ